MPSLHLTMSRGSAVQDRPQACRRVPNQDDAVAIGMVYPALRAIERREGPACGDARVRLGRGPRLHAGIDQAIQTGLRPAWAPGASARNAAYTRARPPA